MEYAGMEVSLVPLCNARLAVALLLTAVRWIFLLIPSRSQKPASSRKEKQEVIFNALRIWLIIHQWLQVQQRERTLGVREKVDFSVCSLVSLSRLPTTQEKPPYF